MTYTRKDRDRDLQALLRQPEFRRWLWDLLGWCGIYRITHAKDHADAAFAEGQRNVGVALIGQVGAVDPTAYPRMMQDLGGSHDDGRNDTDD